jgi:hypothetical protein
MALQANRFRQYRFCYVSGKSSVWSSFGTANIHLRRFVAFHNASSEGQDISLRHLTVISFHTVSMLPFHAKNF